jgi:hypothetical protein
MTAQHPSTPLRAGYAAGEGLGTQCICGWSPFRGGTRMIVGPRFELSRSRSFDSKGRGFSRAEPRPFLSSCHPEEARRSYATERD